MMLTVGVAVVWLSSGMRVKGEEMVCEGGCTRPRRHACCSYIDTRICVSNVLPEGEGGSAPSSVIVRRGLMMRWASTSWVYVGTEVLSVVWMGWMWGRLFTRGCESLCERSSVLICVVRSGNGASEQLRAHDGAGNRILTHVD